MLGVEFIGESLLAQEVRHLATIAAKTDTTVLVTGETGTGKELVAKIIHGLSPRREKPCIMVNCAAVPVELIEAEFFGHLAGAYTSATKDAKGIFASADRGTLVLDEIGDMPVSLQTRFLRFLSESDDCQREIKPVGKAVAYTVDVRVIASSNQDLEMLVGEGKFRSDLFYRINAFHIVIPPLRDRREDIIPIAKFFLGEKFQMSDQVKTQLVYYRWPGNVRQLKNVIQNAARLCEAQGHAEILPEHLRFTTIAASRSLEGAMDAVRDMVFGDASIPEDTSLRKIANDAKAVIEKRLIQKALVQSRWNRKKSAKLLCVSYRKLLYKCREYGIEDKEAVPKTRAARSGS